MKQCSAPGIFFSPFATPHFDHTGKAGNNQDHKESIK